MTPEQHNKYLGWSHVGYGLFFLLMTFLFMIFFGVIFIGGILSEPASPPPVFFFVFVWLFIALIYLAMTVPALIAGYGLLKRKKWARTWAIISAVVAAMQFPFGTAVTVYTFWFLFSDPGKFFFENKNYALPPGQQTWANQQWDYDAQRQRDAHYTPPPPPPDWR